MAASVPRATEYSDHAPKRGRRRGQRAQDAAPERVRDLLERERQALAAAQRALATLVSIVPGTVYRGRNDPMRTMDYVSAGCLELTGYTPAELVSGKVYLGRLIHEDDQQRAWRDIQAALREGRPYRVTYRLADRHGREHWVCEQGRGVAVPGRQLPVVEGFLADITAQRKAEREREELIHIQEAQAAETDARTRDARVLESITDPFLAVGVDGRFIHLNSPAEQLLQLARGDLLGKTIWEAFPEGLRETLFARCQRAAITGATQHFEEYFPTLQKWLEVHVYPSGQGVSLLFHDLVGRARRSTN